MNEVFQRLFAEHGLITAFAAVGVIMWVSYTISKYLTFGRIHGSAIAIILGLILAYAGGIATGGRNGIADIPMFAGMALMGGIGFELLSAQRFSVDLQGRVLAGTYDKVDQQVTAASVGVGVNWF